MGYRDLVVLGIGLWPVYGATGALSGYPGSWVLGPGSWPTLLWSVRTRSIDHPGITSPSGTVNARARANAQRPGLSPGGSIWRVPSPRGPRARSTPLFGPIWGPIRGPKGLHILGTLWRRSWRWVDTYLRVIPVQRDIQGPRRSPAPAQERVHNGPHNGVHNTLPKGSS